jgi:hypothetical protein
MITHATTSRMWLPAATASPAIATPASDILVPGATDRTMLPTVATLERIDRSDRRR